MRRDPECMAEFVISVVLDRLVRHEFKFVVDGEWRCSWAFPTTFDSCGFVNNVLEPVGLDVLAAMSFNNVSPAAAKNFMPGIGMSVLRKPYRHHQQQQEDYTFGGDGRGDNGPYSFDGVWVHSPTRTGFSY